jgi:hypothetical protein
MVLENERKYCMKDEPQIAQWEILGEINGSTEGIV